MHSTGRSHLAPAGLSTGVIASRIPRTGAARRTGRQITVVRQIGQQVIRSNGDVNAPTKWNYQSLFNEAPVCGNILCVLVGDEDIYAKSPSSCVFNVFISVHPPRVLFNQVSIETIHSAPTKQTNVNPLSSSTLHMTRVYDLNEIEASFHLPAIALQAIESVVPLLSPKGSQYRNTLIGTRHNIVPDGADTAASKEAKFIVETINANVEQDVARTQMSLNKGLMAQIRRMLRQSAVSSDFCRVIVALSTSIASQISRHSEVNIWRRQEELRSNVNKQYVLGSLASVYRLAKDPHGFVENMKTCMETQLQNMTSAYNGTSAQMTGDDGRVYPVLGYMAISSCALHTLNALTHNGTMNMKSPVFLQPTEVFRKDNAGNEYSPALLYNPSFPQIDTVPNSHHEGRDMKNLVKHALDLREVGELAKDILSLASSGDSLYREPRANIAQSRQEKYKLYDLDLSIPCQYLRYTNKQQTGVIVIESIEEETPRPEGSVDLESGQTASLLYVRDEMMRVSVGDYDSKNSYLLGWALAVSSANNSGSMATVNGRSLFSTNPVHVRTPGIVLHNEQHTFDWQELLSVMMQPYFYETSRLCETLQDQIRNVERLAGTRMTPIQTLYRNRLVWASRHKEDFKTFVYSSTTGNTAANKISQEALTRLKAIEIRAETIH